MATEIKNRGALLFCLFLICSGALFARPVEYDAEYLKLTREYRLNRDGTTEYHYRKEIRLLTHYAFHNLFGESFIVYNPEYQTLTINEAYTVMADGSRVAVPDNAYNEVLPAFAADAPGYTHLREMVVSHTATEVGALIVLDYTITTKKGFTPYLSGMEEIGEMVPVKEMSFTVRIPRRETLRYRLLNGQGVGMSLSEPGSGSVSGSVSWSGSGSVSWSGSGSEPEVVNHADHKSYRWHYNDLGAVPHSPLHDREQRTYILFSTAAGLDKAWAGFVGQPSFKKSTCHGIRQRVDALPDNKEDELTRILALQKIVADELRTAEVPLHHTGYRVRTIERIWQSAHASSLEKALLLSEMLAYAGTEARPVAVTPAGWFSRELGVLEQFDDYCVEVSPKGMDRIYLPVTTTASQNLVYDLTDKVMIPLQAGNRRIESFTVEVPHGRMEMPGGRGRHGELEMYSDRVIHGELEMDAGLKITAGRELSGQAEISLGGAVNPYWRLYNDPLHLKTVLDGSSPIWSQANTSLKRLSEEQTTATLNLKPGRLSDGYQDYLLFDLPRLHNGFEGWNLKQFPFAEELTVKLKHNLRENYSYNIELPEGWRMVGPENHIVINNDLGSLEISLMQRGNNLVIKRSWELKHTMINATNMHHFSEMVVAWLNPQWRTIMLFTGEEN